MFSQKLDPQQVMETGILEATAITATTAAAKITATADE